MKVIKRPLWRSALRVSIGYILFGDNRLGITKALIDFSEEITQKEYIMRRLEKAEKNKGHFASIRKDIIIVLYGATQIPVFIKLKSVAYWVDGNTSLNDVSFKFKGEWWYDQGDEKLIRKSAVEGCVRQLHAVKFTEEMLDQKRFDFPLDVEAIPSKANRIVRSEVA
ncbi:MAG TPA: hypothetical protein VGE63_01035 [Candidatus Paceibacterota bacterium]